MTTRRARRLARREQGLRDADAPLDRGALVVHGETDAVPGAADDQVRRQMMPRRVARYRSGVGYAVGVEEDQEVRLLGVESAHVACLAGAVARMLSPDPFQSDLRRVPTMDTFRDVLVRPVVGEHHRQGLVGIALASTSPWPLRDGDGGEIGMLAEVDFENIVRRQPITEVAPGGRGR